MIQANTRKDK